MESHNPTVGVEVKEPIINWPMWPIGIKSFRPLTAIQMAIETLIIFESCLVPVSFVDYRNHFSSSSSLNVPSILKDRYTEGVRLFLIRCILVAIGTLIDYLPNATLIKKDRNYLSHSKFNVRKEFIRPFGLLMINLKNRLTWASFIAAISNLVFGVVSGAWVPQEPVRHALQTIRNTL